MIEDFVYGSLYFHLFLRICLIQFKICSKPCLTSKRSSSLSSFTGKSPTTSSIFSRVIKSKLHHGHGHGLTESHHLFY